MCPNHEPDGSGKVIILSGENYLEQLVTLSEATKLTSRHQDEILRMGAVDEIQCYFPITIEKIEVGTLTVIPTEENITNSKCEDLTDWCAISISPYLEDILKEGPDYFNPIREEFPQDLVFRLGKHQVGALLTGKSVYVKYGWLPSGYFFKVVSLTEGLEIRRENILLQKDLLGLTRRVKSKVQPVGASNEEVLTSKRRPDKFKAVPVPEGTRWTDIRIFIGGLEDVTIETNGKKFQRDFRAMGFEDRRSGKEKTGWHLLLSMAFSLGKPEKQISGWVRKKMSDLNKGLIRLFPEVDDGNPFFPYNSRYGWRPKLRLLLSAEMEDEMAAKSMEIKIGQDKFKKIDY